jgi:predicted DNA-binding protein
MPRPLTKGQPISLRFPLAADTRLRSLAEARGMTPAEYLVSRILPALETT